MNSKAFNILRALAEIYLPTLVVFVGSVLAVFAVPTATIALVSGIIAAVNVAVGAIVKYYRAQYNS